MTLNALKIRSPADLSSGDDFAPAPFLDVTVPPTPHIGFLPKVRLPHQEGRRMKRVGMFCDISHDQSGHCST